jgi:hypothetical protein
LSGHGQLGKAEGNLKGARASVDEGLVVLRKLVESDPRNRGLQGELVEDMGTLGAIQQAEGDLPGARDTYAESLAIAKTLAESAPGNAGHQKSLVDIGMTKVDSQSETRRLANVYHARFLPGPQGKYVVAQTDGLFIQQPGHPPEALWPEGSAVLNVVFNRDGSLLGGVAANGAALIRRPPPATEQFLCNPSEQISQWGLFLGPDGKHWISVDRAGKTLLREFPSGRFVATLFQKGAKGIDICFSPDGKWIIGTDRSDTCKAVIWDGRSGEKIRELTGHTALVWRVACSPMGVGSPRPHPTTPSGFGIWPPAKR